MNPVPVPPTETLRGPTAQIECAVSLPALEAGGIPSSSLPPDELPAHLSSETLFKDKVPTAVKVSFGLANMVGIFMTNLTKELLNPVYVVLFGLSPAVVGMAMIVFRLYDAFLDPFIGWFSDNTRSRWGRRRPYLFVGAILSALTMPLVWMVHRDWSPFAQATWLIGSGVVLYTFMSLYGVPYESFTLELTPDYKERTRVNSYKIIISSVAGLLIGWSWFITQMPIFSNPTTGKPDTLAGARGLCTVAGLLVLICGLAPVFFARERFYETASKQAKVSLRESFAATLRNRSFLILVGMALCAVTSSGLSGGITFFTRLYYVCQGNQTLAAKLTGAQATGWLPVSIASVFLFQYIGSRWSKTHSLGLALGLGFLSVAVRWWTYRPDMPWLSLSTMVLNAISTTGLWQLLPSMNADVVDADELATSTRREGAFAAIFSWFMKLSFTIGIGLPGVIVQWCGFVGAKEANQGPGVITAMRLSEILVPSVLAAASLLLMAIYPLSVTRMGEIRRALEARRGTL